MQQEVPKKKNDHVWAQLGVNWIPIGSGTLRTKDATNGADSYGLDDEDPEHTS